MGMTLEVLKNRHTAPVPLKTPEGAKSYKTLPGTRRAAKFDCDL